jgi:short-subunit dehydrogenase
MSRPIALVTGASAGIGHAFVRQLAARGDDVVAVARDRDRLDAIAKELHDEHGVDVEVLAADLGTADGVESVAQRLRDRDRPVETLVNNAGFGTFGAFHELPVEREIAEIDLNVRALVRLTHAALEVMVERGRGGVLNVSSVAARQPTPFNATYGATKAFVTSFTEAVHEEVKSRGVHVCVLMPGFTRTEFQERAGINSSRLPSFLWQEADAVARAGLCALARNRAFVVSGPLNRIAAAFSNAAPDAISRRVAGRVVDIAERPD